MTQNPFAMPKEMRELTEKNIEQAQAAFGQFSDAMSQAMSMWTNAIPTNNMTSGFALVQERAMHYAKQNAEAGMTLANEIAKARDIQEILSLQTSFAQRQMQSYAQQTQELGRLMTEATKGAAEVMRSKT
ncbi:MAG: phasin family protein [Hyphomicrobiaceae bacterium]